MPFTQQVPPIEGGCHYALEIAVSSHGLGPFPTGTPVCAQLRDYETASNVALLSTIDGSIFLVDDQTIELQVPATITARLENTSALVEFMTGDVDPEPIGIVLRLPVLSASRATLGSSTAVVMSMYDIALSRCASRRASTAPTPMLPTTVNTPANSALTAASVQGLSALATALDARLTALGV